MTWVLRDAGVSLAQGYLFSPPLGVKELADWTARHGTTAPRTTV